MSDDGQIDVTISLSDERFFDALNHPEGMLPILAFKAEEIGAAVVGELQQYPPETEANSPGRYSMKNHRPMGYYERGRGAWYPVMNKSTLGDIFGRLGYGKNKIKSKQYSSLMVTSKAAKAYSVAGYKLISNSEQLGSNWVLIVEQKPNDVTITIGNPTSYAKYVQGNEQSSVMKKYGWKTIEDVIASPFFQEVATAREDEAIRQYFNLEGI